MLCKRATPSQKNDLCFRLKTDGRICTSPAAHAWLMETLREACSQRALLVQDDRGLHMHGFCIDGRVKALLGLSTIRTRICVQVPTLLSLCKLSRIRGC